MATRTGLSYVEVLLTPKQSALNTYKFICGDLAEGLNYGIQLENANTCMESIGSNFRFDSVPDARTFVNKFYSEWRNLNGH